MAKLRWDPRFIEIEYELWALAHLRAVLEEQIIFLRDQDSLRTFAELKERGWYHDEAEHSLASRSLDERQDYVIPRFFRGPFIVSLWACYESGVCEIAEYMARRVGAKLQLRDVRAENELAAYQKYFAGVLAFELEADNERLLFLRDLRVIRNALAHANGQRRAMSNDKWTQLCKILAARGLAIDPEESRGVLVLSEAFVERAFDVVTASLRSLVSRARAA